MRQLKEFLDELADRVRSGDGTEAVSVLCEHLREHRALVPPGEWAGVVTACRRHPIQDLLLQDPYTARAFLKPRGYAGDAEMLDYVYTGASPRGAADMARAVFRGTTGLPNGRSVGARRDLLAQQIDEIAASRSNPRVLSIASGHLREAECSAAVSNNAVREFVAFSQDAASLEVVRREQSAHGVSPVRGSVADIVRGRVSFSDFDLVYAAGLFDYLSDEFARRLFLLMFGMLGPGGRLLVANFTPDNHGRGYMECFMDWFLTCRDEGQMASFLEGVEPGRVAGRKVYRDSLNNILYLEVEKA